MMSTLDINKLTQPDLLSKQELCEILRNRCIKIIEFESLSKTELIEIYKRIALPLPQRQYGDKKSKEESKNKTNGNSESEKWDESLTLQNSNCNESDNSSSANLCGKRKGIPQENVTDVSTSSIDEIKSLSKKIRLSTTLEVETNCNGVSEHKVTGKNEDFASTSVKKRQKITWP